MLVRGRPPREPRRGVEERYDVEEEETLTLGGKGVGSPSETAGTFGFWRFPFSGNSYRFKQRSCSIHDIRLG